MAGRTRGEGGRFPALYSLCSHFSMDTMYGICSVFFEGSSFKGGRGGKFSIPRCYFTTKSVFFFFGGGCGVVVVVVGCGGGAQFTAQHCSTTLHCPAVIRRYSVLIPEV